MESLVLQIRNAVGDTQPQFAERVGLGLRSIKRYEKESTLPENKAVLRALQKLAEKHSIAWPKDP